MDGRVVIAITLMLLLAGCRQDQRSLPVIHAASETVNGQLDARIQDRVPARAVPQVETGTDEPMAAQLCRSFLLHRPRSQRAQAVQARLQYADRVTAAFEPRLLNVDLIGDHADILSLQLALVWPADPAYVHRVNSVVEDYLTSADVQDTMCNSGFAEVRLSVKGLNDRRIHPLWRAQVTSEGLLKLGGAPDAPTAIDAINATQQLTAPAE